MFSDRDVPRSLSNQSFHLFNVYGIARYGETMRLGEGGESGQGEDAGEETTDG
jgi:hypothetical protein